MKKNIISLLGFVFLFGLLTGCSTTKNVVQPPLWADSLTVNQIFPEEDFITGIGNGSSESIAMTMADGNIASYFSREISSSTTASQKLSNNENDEQSLNRQININSRITLFGIEHTKGWFNKQEKTWYVCSYLNRVKSWKIYESNVAQEKEKFYSFYNSAQKEKDPFKKISLLNKAKSEGKNYSDILTFAEFLYKKGCQEYSKDRFVIASIDQKIAEINLNLKVKVTVSGELGAQYKKSIEKVLTNNGFLISDKNYFYTVKAEINSNKSKFPGSIVAEPTVTIHIENTNETLFTLSKTADRISGFTEAEILVDKKINNAIIKFIQEDCSELIKKILE